jgi:hypothetical protein
VLVVVGWRNLKPTSHLPGAGGCTVKKKKESKLWYQLLPVSREIDHPPAANHWKEYNILHTQLPQWIITRFTIFFEYSFPAGILKGCL